MRFGCKLYGRKTSWRLLILIGLCCVSFFVLLELFLVVLAGTSILSAVNGVIGVNFRYQLPLLPFMVYLLLSEVSGFKFPESALRRV